MVNKGGVSVRVANPVLDQDADFTRSHIFYQEHTIDRETFIKVSTGDFFVVVIEISPEFDFKGYPEVQIRCTIDGEEKAMWTLIAAEISELRAQNRMRRINHFDTEWFVDNKWMRCVLSFGELGIDDGLNFGPESAAEDATTLGRIVVTITKGSVFPSGDSELLEPHECPEDVKFAARAV